LPTGNRILPIAVFACGVALTSQVARAADWLNAGGDPQRSNWQRREKVITTANAKNLQLIWKLKLSQADRDLTAPVILGHLVTNRGKKELIYVADSDNNVYSVDADLGRLFWKRGIQTEGSSCTSRAVSTLTAAPALTPGSPLPPGATEEDEDAPEPLRPLYVLSSDGMLHKLHPGTGADMGDPRKFVPAGSSPTDLLLYRDAVYTTTRVGCGGPAAVWALRLADAGAKPVSHPEPRVRGVSAGPKALLADLPGKIVSLTFDDLKPASETSDRSTGTAPGITAIAEDATGAHIVFAAAGNTITAFRESDPKTRLWTARLSAPPGIPVASNGVVYVVAGAALHALNAMTGVEIYTSEAILGARSQATALAVANGHVCFGARDSTLYCFGFPVDQ
jgi:hypothetical protein